MALLAWCLSVTLDNIGNAAFVPKHEFPVFASISVLRGLSVPYEAHRLVEGEVDGPETVIPIGNNQLMTFTKTGSISQISRTGGGKIEKQVNLGGKTRPLGAAFSEDGDLYIADAVRGLLKVSTENKVEVVASSVGGSPILYCNDVEVGTSSGAVYFTDSTDIAPQPVTENGRTTFDTLGASILDVLRGSKKGRVLKYDPQTKRTSIVVDGGIWFANGITVSKDETHALVCETFAARVLKVDLSSGATSIFSTDSFPGYCDGISYSPDELKVYVSVPSPPPKIMSLLEFLSDETGRVVRSLLMALPPYLRPKPVKAGLIIALDATTGGIVEAYLDPHGEHFEMVSSVVENPEDSTELFIGTLTKDFVGVLKKK